MSRSRKTVVTATGSAPSPSPGEAAGPDAVGSPTAWHMLDVAERLFAQRGIEAVSAREIVAASGQRNISAVAYHFGSREGLLGALLRRRLRQLNSSRIVRLQSLAEAGHGGDVHAIVGASFGVLADAVRQELWGGDFVLILAQVLFQPALDFEAMVGADLRRGDELARRMVRQALPSLPLQVFLERAEMTYNHGTYALARWVRRHGAVSTETQPQFEAMVRNTVDVLAAGVMAPVSPRRPRSGR